MSTRIKDDAESMAAQARSLVTDEEGARRDLRLLHNFQVGTELPARDWQSQ